MHVDSFPASALRRTRIDFCSILCRPLAAHPRQQTAAIPSPA